MCLQKFLDKYYDSLIKKVTPRPSPRKKAPNVLLLNKQICREAIGLLQTRSLAFDHGIFVLKDVSRVISSNLLQQVTSIEINDIGHPIIRGNILPESWAGYMKLFTNLAHVLAKGHKLKSFIVNFTDSRLAEHMTVCWDADYECGFRDQMRDATDALRKIRGVEKVEIKGINDKHAQELVEIMQSTPRNFMDLPREIRDMVYEYAVDPSDITTSINRSMANWADRDTPFPYPARSTPNVLLINRQISNEAREMLDKKPLVLTFADGNSIKQEAHVPSILQFITRPSLQNVRVLHLSFESWEWIFNLNRRFVSALAASTKLGVMHISFYDRLKDQFIGHGADRYPDRKLNVYFKLLTAVRGLKEVVFKGDLPDCYTKALVAIMTSSPTAGEVLPPLLAIKADGEFEEIDDDQDEREATMVE